jgi:hypothetical protein
MQRAAMRALFIPVYGLAGFGTMAAYMHFVAGVIAGFDGIAKGRYFLGPVLSLLCMLGGFALWRVWSIGGRIWRYGAYTNASPKDHAYDRAGVAAAGAAFIGFVAIASAIYRGDELVYFGMLLMPATCLAIITFLWIKSDPSPASVNENADDVRSAVGLRLADLPGLVCGTALGLYGVYHFVPLPMGGWGACEWTVFYPLRSDLWPVQRMEISDACSDSAWTLCLISSVLSLVCLVVGAAAAVIGKNASAARGARAVAIVVAVVLARLAIQKSDTPDAPYLAWVESLIAGAFIVVGAAWVGYVGGRRGVALRRRLFGRTSSLNTLQGRST